MNNSVPETFRNTQTPFMFIDFDQIMRVVKQEATEPLPPPEHVVVVSAFHALELVARCGNYDLFRRLINLPQARKCMQQDSKALYYVIHEVEEVDEESLAEKGYLKILLETYKHTKEISLAGLKHDVWATATRGNVEGVTELLNHPVAFEAMTYAEMGDGTTASSLGMFIARMVRENDIRMLRAVLDSPVMKKLNEVAPVTFVLVRAFQDAMEQGDLEKISAILQHPCAKYIPVERVGKVYISILKELMDGNFNRLELFEELKTFCITNNMGMKLAFNLKFAVQEQNVSAVRKLLANPQAHLIPLEEGKYSLYQIAQKSQGEIQEILQQELKERRQSL